MRPRFHHPLSEPCLRFSLTRLSPRQSARRIPPCQGCWRETLAIYEAPPRCRVGRCRTAHLARGPSLRRVLLSTPIIATVWPPPTSARRSATSRATVIGFAPSWRLRAGFPGPYLQGRDGYPTFRAELSPRSDPTTPAGSSVLRLQGLRTSHGLRPGYNGSAPASSAFDACAGFLIVRTAALLAALGDFVVGLRRLRLHSRRPPATRLLGHYRDRTFTG